LRLTKADGEWVLEASAYRLVFLTERPFVMLESAQGERLAELFVFSSIHPLDGRDDTFAIGEWAADEADGLIEVSVSARSTAWASKTYRFRCSDERFTFGITVEARPGESPALAEAHYFGGYYSGSLRWGSGFFWSGQRFAQIFNPEPNIPEIFHVPASSGSKIDLTGVPIPARGDWFFTPPPMCFAAQTASGWIGFGLETPAGENTYTDYAYHGNLQAFELSIAYEGHTVVDGRFELPSIGFDFAPDEYSAIQAHADALRRAGRVAEPETAPKPRWWRSPIFCGWGPQCYLAVRDGGHAPAYARQEHYEQFMATLDEHALNPGVIVIDDKWQAAYGENDADPAKWPDLRGFIDGQHGRGRKVLLWLKAWDPEGVPLDECIVNGGGAAVAFDPTHPQYERRLRNAVRRMLSGEAGAYDADGFKIDFTARIPSGYGLKNHDARVWGIELMRRYLTILRSEAKALKPDALIMTHTPHPYLADLVDMIRLNDINMGTDINRVMRHRARIAAIACPKSLIDTDNWPITDKAAWRAYTQIQPELGIPSLYTLTHIDSTQEALDAEDYAVIREVWAQYLALQDA
jgi:hypothetical protein